MSISQKDVDELTRMHSELTRIKNEMAESAKARAKEQDRAEGEATPPTAPRARLPNEDERVCLRRHPCLPEYTPISDPPEVLPDSGSSSWDGPCVAFYALLSGGEPLRMHTGELWIRSKNVVGWAGDSSGDRRPLVVDHGRDGRPADSPVDAEMTADGIRGEIAYVVTLPMSPSSSGHQSWQIARAFAEWLFKDTRRTVAAARLGRMAERFEARVEEAVSGLSTKEQALVRSRIDGAGAKTDGGEPQARSAADSQPTVAANRPSLASVRFVVDGRRRIVLERPEIEAIRRLSVADAVARVMEIHWRIGLAAAAAVLARYAKLSKSEDEIALAVNGVAAFARGEISRDIVVDDLANLCRHGDVTQCCRVFDAALSLLSGAALVIDGASTVGHSRLRRYVVEAMQGIAVAKSGADRFYVCDSIGKIVVDDMIRDARIELGAELAAVIEEMSGARLGTASNASDGGAKP